MLQELDYFTEPLPDPAVRLLMVQVANMRFVLLLTLPPASCISTAMPSLEFRLRCDGEVPVSSMVGQQEATSRILPCRAIERKAGQCAGRIAPSSWCTLAAGTRCACVCVCAHAGECFFDNFLCASEEGRKGGREGRLSECLSSRPLQVSPSGLDLGRRLSFAGLLLPRMPVCDGLLCCTRCCVIRRRYVGGRCCPPTIHDPALKANAGRADVSNG